MRDLGDHEGYLDEIAKNLSSLAFYALHFERVNPKKTTNFPPPTQSVCVSIDGYQDPLAIKQMLKERPVKTERGSYYQTLKLTF